MKSDEVNVMKAP